MFRNAITRTPGKSLTQGLSSAGLGLPDHPRALKQHAQYIQALESCGLKVRNLGPLEAFPDSTFVEDVALMTPHCAIITRPGAQSRRDEIEHIQSAVEHTGRPVHHIEAPGTLEAGDIMMVGDHFYIGLSERSNQAGAHQAIAILEEHGMSGSLVSMKDMLHLKTGLAYLEHNNLLVFGEFASHPDFSDFNRIEIPAEESYAANCIWVNDRVLVPASHPRTSALIKAAGYDVLEIDVSEFQKLDGGLSCLSLRF